MSFIAPGERTKVGLVATSLIKTKFRCQSGVPGQTSDLVMGQILGGEWSALQSTLLSDTERHRSEPGSKADSSIWSLTREQDIDNVRRYVCQIILFIFASLNPASLHKHYFLPNQHQDEYQNQNDFKSSQIKTLTL